MKIDDLRKPLRTAFFKSQHPLYGHKAKYKWRHSFSLYSTIVNLHIFVKTDPPHCDNTMPNTLIHMGAGRILGRALFRDADDKWIYIGCVIPDIPWIFQRAVSTFYPGINLLDLRLYSIIQASLAFCLLFSVAVSLLFQRPLRIFLLLGFNCLLHLLLDTGQIKWANGVHLLAPLSWEMTGYGFLWPENILTYLLTGFGLAMTLWYWQPAWRTLVYVLPPSLGRMLICAGLLTAYMVLPLLLLSGPEQADNHYIATLRSRNGGPGDPSLLIGADMIPAPRRFVFFPVNPST